MTQNTPLSRRALLGGIAGTTITGLSGCTSDNGENSSGPRTGGFETVIVEGTDLVVELVDDHPLDRLSIIDPNGEQFAEQGLPAGVTRQTFPLGSNYRPGEYEIIGIADDEMYSSTSMKIKPDITITDLRLGLNHPDEMYETFTDRGAEREVLIQVENSGLGHDSLRRLTFSGNVPRPSPDDQEESGILDTDSEIALDAEEVILPPGEERTIFSNSMPFGPGADGTVCAATSSGSSFEVHLETSVNESGVTRSYELSHSSSEESDCEVEVEE